jgi:hypothetical protein
MTPQHIHTFHLQDKVLTVLKHRFVKSGIELSMPIQQIVLQNLPENGMSEHSDTNPQNMSSWPATEQVITAEGDRHPSKIFPLFD